MSRDFPTRYDSVRNVHLLENLCENQRIAPGSRIADLI